MKTLPYEHGKGAVSARILFIVLLAACLTQGALVPAEDRLPCILKGIRQTYHGLPGLTVPYIREVVTRSMSMLSGQLKGDSASGHLYFRPPDFLKIRQEIPRTEVITTNGESLWWYIPEEKVVYQYPREKFGREMKILTDLFQGLGEVEKNFQVSMSSLSEGAGRRIELIPTPAWEDIERIGVVVSKDYQIREVEIQNALGGVTRFILKPFTPEKFPKEFFRFEVPKGVRLVKEQD